jgi:hypothetical protein
LSTRNKAENTVSALTTKNRRLRLDVLSLRCPKKQKGKGNWISELRKGYGFVK